LCRYKTFIALQHEVMGISMVPVLSTSIDKDPTFLERIMWKLKLPLDLTHVNEKLKELIAHNQYDVAWIEKGNTIIPKILRLIKNHLPRCKVVSCSEDDMYALHNYSLYYRFGLKYYDIVFTTKVYNLTELEIFGAKKMKLFLDNYDEVLHRPLELSAEDRHVFGTDVGFIGTFEKERMESMLYLAQCGVRVRVWGNGWKSYVGKNPNLIIENKAIYGENYVKAINATKINLGFLRKANRDEVTTRSVEIPACGSFMLAEWTKRHLDFFEDGKEAVFFRNNEELLRSVKMYLSNDDARKKIAAAGRERCLKSGYSMKVQLSEMLSSLFS
jgi:spore maturation protein CgeB